MAPLRLTYLLVPAAYIIILLTPLLNYTQASNDLMVESADSQYRVGRAVGDCGGTFYDNTGIIASPNWPAAYTDNKDCYYYITVASGSVQLTFDSFSTQSINDYIYIYDGLATSDLQIGYFTGSTRPNILISSGSDLLVHFHSDAGINDSGFYATYISTEDTWSFVSSCGGSLTTDTGAFTSPNYPGSYDYSSACSYYISVSADSTVQLTFQDFSTESCCDKLYIYDGHSRESSLIGTFSGTTVPSIVLSTGPKMLVYFESDNTESMSGFYASYTMGSGKISSVCGTDTITSLGGLLQSHEKYPEDYTSPISCNVTLFGIDLYKNIYIQFLDVHLHRYDYINIYEESLVQPIGEVHSYSESNGRYTSYSSMGIVFTSREAHSGEIYRGFKAVYSLYYVTDGYCLRGNDFHCGNNRCISGSLKCDSYDHCGDNSDENGCSGGVNYGAIFGGVAGVIVVFVVMAHLHSRKKKKVPTATLR